MELPDTWKRIDGYAIEHKSKRVRVSKAITSHGVLYTAHRKSGERWYQSRKPATTNLETAIANAEEML